jgi:hypothetical protein
VVAEQTVHGYELDEAEATSKRFSEGYERHTYEHYSGDYS